MSYSEMHLHVHTGMQVWIYIFYVVDCVTFNFCPIFLYETSIFATSYMLLYFYVCYIVFLTPCIMLTLHYIFVLFFCYTYLSLYCVCFSLCCTLTIWSQRPNDDNAFALFF